MIIGISGKIGSGKDLAWMLINYLLMGAEKAYLQPPISDFIKCWDDAKNPDGSYNIPFQNRKFADKLKDIVCMLLGCTREMLEDRAYKNTVLGPEWNRYRLHNMTYELWSPPYFVSEEEAWAWTKTGLHHDPHEPYNQKTCCMG